ncbi:chaperone of endosialidase-domain-containing protein, partial [Baffinella frigidus]
NYALLQQDTGATFLNASANQSIQFRINNSQKMVIDKDGNFGINTTTPSQKLHVNGNAKIEGYIQSTHNTDPLMYFTDNSGNRLVVGYKEDNTIMQNSLTAQILVDSSGNIKYISRTNTNAGHYFYSGNGVNRVYIGNTATGSVSSRYLALTGERTTSTNLSSISIKSIGGIWATGIFVTTSDVRIKQNIRELDDDECLSIVRKLNPCKYNYKDSIKRGNKDVIGFIAQEVEAVFPQATSRDNIEYIPSHYEKCEVADDIIKTTKPHEFIVGDKLKFYDSEDKEILNEVIQVIDEYTFKINETLEYTDLFIYGKEVNDLCILDKASIYTLGISAIQELDRKCSRY